MDFSVNNDLAAFHQIESSVDPIQRDAMRHELIQTPVDDARRVASRFALADERDLQAATIKRICGQFDLADMRRNADVPSLKLNGNCIQVRSTEA